jgi:hypothetical protein
MTYDRTHLQHRHRELLELAAQETDACTLWTHANYKGYGMFALNKKTLRAHVYVCEMYHGPRPTPAHEVAHNCGVRACVNPAHLRWATRAENHADKKLHGTHRQGETHHTAKYSDADIRMMRALREAGIQVKHISEAFNCNYGYACKLINGHQRKDA